MFSLQHVRSPRDLCDVFVDVITTHHMVWETYHVLHGDISYSNIAFDLQHTEDGTQQASGMLIDWDSASSSTAKCGAKESKSTRKLGPFTACELLQDIGRSSYSIHKYRHDLESFFWVLVWFCAVFDPANPTVLRAIPTWRSSDLVDLGHAKARFFTRSKDFEQVTENTSPAYRGFIKTWIIQFCNVFSRSFEASEQERIAAEEYVQNKLCLRGKVRDKWEGIFVEDWNAARARLREMDSYEDVMEILGDLENSPLPSQH
ncbi:hypothetical protein EIP91_010681 [Steccherinum ochraceum]|uniref:Fungal-type protein kinase domain-containing protein n=1 Tax=Steccherinum ochraceum TaxID=92696 RepID=A0A4R0R2W3_9APHY|nr:hypothetical protein EIP91_010681 [Steccherinum ochraceum]